MAVRQCNGRISRVRAVQMDNLIESLRNKKMDITQKARIKELCVVKKGVNERIDKGVLRWFGHVKRMHNFRIDKIIYVRECACSHSVGKPRKRWIDSVSGCLRKRSLDVRQARSMV